MTKMAQTGAGGVMSENNETELAALLVGGMDDAAMLSDVPFLEAGVRPLRADTIDEAATMLEHERPDLLFLPIALNGRPMRPLFDRAFALRPLPVLVVVASNDQINAAAEAMRAGAFDCLFRPFSPQRLAKTVEAAIEALPPARRLAAKRASAPAAPTGHAPLGQNRTVRVQRAPGPARVIFTSPEMRAVMGRIEALARSDVPVFLQGEQGTGKALLARRLHDLSRRESGEFITVDCVSLAPERVADVLGGPVGALAQASGGTVYFDEIGALHPDAQLRLLNLLDEVAPPADETTPGARLVSGTRADPSTLLREGRLDADLFYRLHVASIALPPLRRRRGDIAAIASGRLADFARAEGRAFQGIRADAMARLEAHDWPGNVPELVNAIWSAVVMNDGPLLTPEMLPAGIGASRPGPERSGQVSFESLVGMTLAEMEQALIEATVQAEGGSVPRAARVLDVAPSTIYRKREAWAARNRR